MPDMTKAEDLAAVEADLLTWMAIHGNLCLALRHPGNQGPSAQLVSDFAHALLAMLIDRGLLSPAEADQVSRVEVEETTRGRA